MDAKRLSATKSMLKRRSSQDRSAPMVDDAAHPGSAGVLRAISMGHFELKSAGTRDASGPLLEEGTGFKADIRPAVFAEIQDPKKRSSLKGIKSNDRSDPVIEKWVHVDVTGKHPRKGVIDELKEKKGTIDALSDYNAGHGKEAVEKFTRPALMGELKSFKGFIDEKAYYNAKNSVAELQKKVSVNVINEIKQKKESIEQFTAYAAEHQSEDNYRSKVNTGLVNEIKMKRPSINALTDMHRKSSGLIGVN